jgi:cell filamentation protein
MRQKPGEVMGYLAHGHPFLDGNGRTIMLVHAELARRAGFGIDWGSTGKTITSPRSLLSWKTPARANSINT